MLGIELQQFQVCIAILNEVSVEINLTFVSNAVETVFEGCDWSGGTVAMRGHFVSEFDFNVKYNGANPTPEVKRIYVNGLLICPQSMSIDNRSTERKPALGKFWSQFKDKFTNNSDVTSEETTSKSDETTTSELPQPKIFFFDIEE